MKLTNIKHCPASLFLCACISISPSVRAFSLDDLSNKEASSGLKAALDQGAASAVGKLGVENGFLNNEKVKIGLPGILEKALPLIRMTGQGKQVDELMVAMNRAAESAIPMAKPLLINAVKSITFTDAKNILTGGESSVTDFFKEKTSVALTVKFMPVVKKVTDKSGLSAKYNSVMEQAQKYTAIPAQEQTVEAYVTARAVDGLYLMIAEEEKNIRKDPLGSGSKLIGKVFGLLQ